MPPNPTSAIRINIPVTQAGAISAPSAPPVFLFGKEILMNDVSQFGSLADFGV
jgi:hypothetical protein